MENIEYIEAYFTNTLNVSERKTFELKIETDKQFASDVAFYITSRQVLQEELLDTKQKLWATETLPQQIIERETPVRKIGMAGWVKYAVAACTVLLLGSIYFLNTKPNANNLAAKYIKSNYSQLSQTMDASKDSLQLGIAAYNKKDYTNALTYFNGVANADSTNSDPKKYAGLCYLKLKNYDKAIEQFDELAKMKYLFSNQGLFLKAITLLQKNNEPDNEAAKNILQQVVNEKLEGAGEAVEILKNM